MVRKLIGIFSLISFGLTLIWLIIMVMGVADYGGQIEFEDILGVVSRLDSLYYITYINATVITISVTMLFSLLYLYCKARSAAWSFVGVIFVPVYGLMNLISYLSQVTLVPYLIELTNDSVQETSAELVLKLTIQQWPRSFIWFTNNLGYAILGISSIIFGVLMYKERILIRVSSILLALNGIACIVGVIGVLIDSGGLATGSLVGGVIFFILLLPMSIGFLRKN